jgi:chitin disaccharide deacetylase
MQTLARKHGANLVASSLLVVITFGLLLTAPTPLAADDIRVIVRGDDFGMSEGNLEAIERGMNEGVLTCASLLVPAPWFKGAAALARRNSDWCMGVHLCLVGEWRGYSWRPVLPWDKVPSIVDDKGFLYGSPKELFSHHPKIEEMDAELRAQIELAKKEGVNLQYLDTHYLGLNDYPGLGVAIRKIASDYGLPFSEELGEKQFSVYTTRVSEKLKTAIQELVNLSPGLWLWVCHVGIDSPEQRALIHTAPEDIFLDGGVGANRSEELKVVTSLDVKSTLLKRNIKLTKYGDVWRQMHRH